MPDFCSFLLQNSVDFKLENFLKFDNFLEQTCSTAGESILFKNNQNNLGSVSSFSAEPKDKKT